MGKWLQMIAALVAATTAVVGAQEHKEAPVIDTGQAIFLTYCASCHGRSGRGNGPSAEEFRRVPADLTQFATKNGGVFNKALIHAVIDGRSVKSHGDMEMPVWGDAFKWRLGLDEDTVNKRIEAIVRYLESIQERTGH